MPSFTQWQTSREYPAGDAPFEPTVSGGPPPFFHNLLDERRSMWRATPEAQYPDGYLGTLESRRADRLTQWQVQRSQQRPFTRGVHKGDRIDLSSYFWPDEFNPMTGLMMEAAGAKYAPVGLGMELNGDPRWDMMTIGPRGIPRARTAVWSEVPPGQDLTAQAPPYSTGRQPMGIPDAGYGRM